jgi:hypothetical protein
VLESGNDPVVFKAADVRGAELGDQVGIFSHGFLNASPAIVADYVEHRRERLMDADRCHVAADRGSHLVDQFWVESGRPRPTLA